MCIVWLWVKGAICVCIYMCDRVVAVVVVVFGGIMCLCGGGLLAELPACVF